jgi:hypothetical protein
MERYATLGRGRRTQEEGNFGNPSLTIGKYFMEVKLKDMAKDEVVVSMGLMAIFI